MRSNPLDHHSGVNLNETQVDFANGSPSLGFASYQDVLGKTSSDDLELLSELSLLDNFTLEEASKISNYPDLDRRFMQMVRKNYLSTISEAPKRFQLSYLLHDEFRSELAKNPKKFKSVALKSAKAVQVTHPLKAVELFGLAGDIDGATRIITSNLQRFLLHSDMELLTRWAPVISEALGGGLNREKLIKVYGLLSAGKFEQIKSMLREIEVGLLETEEDNLVAQDMGPIKLYLDFAFGNFSKLINTTSPTKSKLWKDKFSDRIILMTYFYTQDTKRFSSYLETIDLKVSQEGAHLDFVYVNSFRAMSKFLAGNYREASEYALAACNLAEELGAEGAYFPFESAFILMDTALEFGDENKSQGFVDKYLPRAIRTHQYPWITALYAKAALIKAQSGRIDSALALIRKGRDSVEGPLFGPNITFILDGHEMIVRLPLGDMERIKELLFKLEENTQNNGIETFKYSLEIMSNPTEAERIIELMPKDTDQDNFRKELMLATAYIGKPNLAIGHIKKAIELAVPNGYFRAFLNLPPKVKDLILDLASKTPSNYLENLSRAIRYQAKQTALVSSSLERPLTKQELLILRRLETGLPIAQIAGALSISKNTIKTHLKSIYRKLAAESREDAVSKAKEMMLL
jgi:DNA-binding NarL/FixJ family response regulator